MTVEKGSPTAASNPAPVAETSIVPGLASLAGGWPGSDELVRQIEASPRFGKRTTPDLDGDSV
jgi:hypothetical protein